MHTDALSATFAALADPTRRAILARLTSGETSVTELAAPFDMSLPAVSKHLKVLENAGLIVRSREAQWRPCKLDAAPMRQASEWLERYARFWSDSLDRLAAYVENEAAAKPRRKAKKTRRG
jgi:DNA-binding transcriptional ArsR family regulator